jgi:hypothetical protein
MNNLGRKIKSFDFHGLQMATRISCLHYRAEVGQSPFRHCFPFAGSESRTILLTYAKTLKLCNQIKSQKNWSSACNPNNGNEPCEAIGADFHIPY